MKLENTGSDVIDLDFEVPEPGTSILEIQEGIRKNFNENSGKTTLLLPFMIDRVVEGPDGNEGLKLSHFVPIETAFGEKQLAGILTITDLIDQFAKKFNGEVDCTDDRFLDALKLKLVGKRLTAVHTLRADKNGRERPNIVKFERATNSKPQPVQKEIPSDSRPAAANDGGDDW
jgi:hypothetical protein